MAVTVTTTHTKTLLNPDTGTEDKVYGKDYVSASSHTSSITGGTDGQMARGRTGLSADWSVTTWPDTIGNLGGVLHQAFGSDNVDVRQSFTFNGATLQVAADAVTSDMTIKVEHVGSGVGTGRALFLAEGQASGGDALITWTIDTVQSWSAGADNSASAAWKLSASAALGTTDVITATPAGDVTVGRPSPATTAAVGFPQVPTMAGAPTGVPTVIAGFNPVVYDTTNKKIWVYDYGSAAWKFAQLT